MKRGAGALLRVLQLRPGSEERVALGREAAAHVKEVALNGARFVKYKARFPGV